MQTLKFKDIKTNSISLSSLGKYNEFLEIQSAIKETPLDVVENTTDLVEISEPVVNLDFVKFQEIVQALAYTDLYLNMEFVGKNTGLSKLIYNHVGVVSKENKLVRIFNGQDYVKGLETLNFLISQPKPTYKMYFSKVMIEDDMDFNEETSVNIESVLTQQSSGKSMKQRVTILNGFNMKDITAEMFDLIKEYCSKDNYNLDCIFHIDSESLDNEEEPLEFFDLIERRKYGK